MKPSVQQIPVPTLPAAPPAPPPITTSAPQGQKPQKKSAAASYLNAGDVPSKQNIGQKQLVGQ